MTYMFTTVSIHLYPKEARSGNMFGVGPFFYFSREEREFNGYVRIESSPSLD